MGFTKSLCPHFVCLSGLDLDLRLLRMLDDLMRVHGVAPAAKLERLVYENVDGFRNNISGNDKLDKAKEAGSGSYYE